MRVLVVDYIPTDIPSNMAYDNLGKVFPVIQKFQNKVSVKTEKGHLYLSRENVVDVTELSENEVSSVVKIFKISGVMRNKCIKALKETGHVDLEEVTQEVVREIEIGLTNQAIKLGLE